MKESWFIAYIQDISKKFQDFNDGLYVCVCTHTYESSLEPKASQVQEQASKCDRKWSLLFRKDITNHSKVKGTNSVLKEY